MKYFELWKTASKRVTDSPDQIEGRSFCEQQWVVKLIHNKIRNSYPMNGVPPKLKYAADDLLIKANEFTNQLDEFLCMATELLNKESK